MARFRELLRLSVLAAAALAVSSVPVVRAFAAESPFASASAMSSDGAGRSAAHLAHRMPRLRRPKQSLVAIVPESGPVPAPAVSSRRSVPSRELPVRAASFAALPDHPPA